MVKHKTDTIVWYSHLDDPLVLMLSGMHGDEYESGALLEEYLKANSLSLSSFLYIPKVSPSAVACGKRTNAYGNDINRQFLATSTDPETRTVMQLLQDYRFHIAIDVHEDPDRTLGFYLYDTGHMTAEELEHYRATVHGTNARLYTGIDDVDDENLNLSVERGYVSLGIEQSGASSGFSSRWLYTTHVSQRIFTLEIPGRGPRSLKASLIHAVIPFLLAMNGVV